jgi:uncharacterized integral membrane protein (TIGR00698 family)
MNIIPPSDKDFYKGFFIVVLFASAATYIAGFDFLKSIGISPLIVGIVLGMLFGNTFRQQLPSSYTPGIIYNTKIVLRTAIIFYGFRITFQQIAGVGFEGLLADIIMLGSTFLMGSFLGIKWLKMDEETTYMCAAGASVCGAAAVLATEPVVKAESYKTSVSVATVVVFGTLAMFLYPVLYKTGIFGFDFTQMGIYIGASVHEVAHVVGAGNAISPETADVAVIVKMARVMLLVPLLILLSYFLSKRNSSENNQKSSVKVPWFAVGFIFVSGFNSFQLLPLDVVKYINTADTFLLTMAMTALGMETTAQKFKNVGGKPFLLAFIMFLWLILFGWITTYAISFF